MARRRIQHGMIFRAKNVMDDALPELGNLRELVPERLHGELDKVIALFEDTLCDCDISADVEQLQEYLEAAKRP